MTFFYVMGAIILAGLGAAIATFRKGGVYNPLANEQNDTAESLTPPPAPSEPITGQKPVNLAPTAKADMLTVFCTAIRDFEGKPGDLNYMLNNPGDCRPSPVGYLAKYQPVEIIDTDTDPRYPFHKGKFAKFPTPALGWEYLVNMVHVMAINHPNWTILDFFAHFAPASDGNAPVGYSNNVAKRCGVSVNTTLAELFGKV